MALMVMIIALVVVAAVLQRITGMGFAMMLAPFLVVMVGPHGGVILTNALSFLAPLLMIAAVWRDIDWRRLAVILPAALVCMPLFGWMMGTIAPGPLYIVVGLIVILALGTSLVLDRINIHVDGFGTKVAAGVGTGGGVVLAGVGAPAMTAYAVLSRWDVSGFAATLQPLWAVMACAGFATNYFFSGNELPDFPWWFWVACVPGILIGMTIGGQVRKVVSETLVRRAVIGLAFIGGLLSLVTGIGELSGP